MTLVGPPRSFPTRVKTVDQFPSRFGFVESVLGDLDVFSPCQVQCLENGTDLFKMFEALGNFLATSAGPRRCAKSARLT